MDVLRCPQTLCGLSVWTSSDAMRAKGLKFDSSKANFSLCVLSSLFISDVSKLGVELTGTLVVATRLLSPVEGNLLGVK